MNPTQANASGLDAFFAKIEKLSKIQRILIFAGVFIVIIAIFVFVLYKPKLEEIGKLGKQLKSLEKKTGRRQEKCRRFEKISKENGRGRGSV